MKKNDSITKKKIHEAKNYLKSTFNNFISSFKNIDRTIIFIVAYKLIFYAACVFMFFKFRDILLVKAEPLMGIDPGVIRGGPSPELSAVAETIKSFYIGIVMYALIFVLILLAVYIAANFLIWSRITRKKIKNTKHVFAARFFLLNVLWVVPWLFLAAIIVRSVRVEVLIEWMLGMVLLYIHLTAVLYISYFKTGKAARAVRKAFDIGFTKIHYFMVPYLFAAIIFTILNIVLAPFKNYAIVLGGLSRTNTFTLIAFLFYAAWLRIYIYSFAKDLV